MIDSFQNHPISLIIQFVKHFSLQQAVFEFSCYINGERGKTRKRRIISIQGKQINTRWLKTTLLSLEKGEELALHSRIEKDGKYYYLPQIDFWGKSFVKALDELQLDLKSLHLYGSGKSFHGYYCHLLNEKDWQIFLGKLLLFSPFDMTHAPYVDYRWIGYSLKNGYSALRWSNNSARYLSFPLLVKLGKQSFRK